MKKIISLVGLSVFILQTLQVQGQENAADKKFGLRAGANFSHINFAKGVPPPTVPINTSWGAGINIGFLMQVRIAEGLYIQPEYAYSQMGGEVKAANTVYKLNYLSLPVFLKYYLDEKFSVMAGPQFDLLINAKRTINGSAVNITHDTEERSLAAVAGVEYQFTGALSLAARYMYGFNHIGIGQRSDIQEFKFEVAQVMACFRF